MECARARDLRTESLVLAYARDEEQQEQRSVGYSTLTGSTFAEDYPDLWLPPTSSMHLFGRAEEQKLLLEAYNRASCGSSEICFVSGESGVGKSSLVESLRDTVASKGRGFFVSGKYDQLQKDPYSALVAAFTDLVDLITQSGGLSQLLLDLEKLVGSDMRILTTLISNLPLPSHLRKNKKEDKENMNQAFTRLKRLSRFFLQAASSSDRPILLLLDDLQWCDSSSRKIIKALMSDLTSKHVLLVGTFREDQDSQSVRELLIGAAPPHSRLRLTEIKLKNLSESVIAVLVGGMMNGLEYVDEVATILKSKTGGNPYFLLRFLEMARDKNLLHVSANGTWVCDVERFQNETHVSENLVELVSSRLRTLEPKVLELLTVASALGYLLDKELLYRVAVSEEIIEANEQSRMDLMLQSAVRHGFIEPSRGGFDFKFTHDRVQSCLYSLFESEEHLEALHLRIGKLLMQRRKEIPGDDKVVFYAVEQWNRGSKLAKKNSHDREMLLQVNFLAAGLAISKTSFGQGCEYYSKVVDLVNPDEIWTTRHDFALDLFSSYAEALNHNGSFVESIRLCHEILARTASLQEKLRAYWALATALGSQGKNQEAVDMGVAVMRKLGVRIPRRPTAINAAVEVIKTKKAMKSKTHEDILNLPLMSDWRKVAVMKMMSKIIMLIYMNFAQKNAFIIMGLRMVSLSCKYGLTSMTPYGLANYALILVMFGDYDEAYRVGRLSLQLIEQLGATDSEVPTSVILNHFVFHWRVSTSKCAEEMRRLYLLGRETGDVEFSYSAAVGFIAFSHLECESLHDLEGLGNSLCHLLSDFPHRLVSLLIPPFLQGVHNLMGKGDGASILTGEILNEPEWEAEVRREKSPILNQNMEFTKVFYAFQFGAAERMLQILPKLERDENAIRGIYHQYMSKWLCGMSYFRLYKLKGKRRFKQRALTHFRAVRKWSIDGVDNCTPFYYLLDAERLSLSDMAASKAAYDKAIVCSSERKMYLYQAMALECAGLALMCHNTEIARGYLVSARDLWEQLDGMAKVQYMKQKLSLIRSGDSPTRIDNEESQPTIVWINTTCTSKE